MNIHLPAILGFTRYQGFDPSPLLILKSFWLNTYHCVLVIDILFKLAPSKKWTKVTQGWRQLILVHLRNRQTYQHEDCKGQGGRCEVCGNFHMSVWKLRKKPPEKAPKCSFNLGKMMQRHWDLVGIHGTRVFSNKTWHWIHGILGFSHQLIAEPKARKRLSSDSFFARSPDTTVGI